jgi:hypothetical protein
VRQNFSSRLELDRFLLILLPIEPQKMHTVFYSGYLGRGQMTEDKDNSREIFSRNEVNDALFGPREHPVEVTGLGIVAALVIAVLFLVSDGTLRLSVCVEVITVLLLVAGGLIWRLAKLLPGRKAGSRSEHARASNGH